MVNHICSNCGEIFNKKSTFNYHVNRKISCIKIAPIAPEIAPIAPEISNDNK